MGALLILLVFFDNLLDVLRMFCSVVSIGFRCCLGGAGFSVVFLYYVCVCVCACVSVSVFFWRGVRNIVLSVVLLKTKRGVLFLQR